MESSGCTTPFDRLEDRFDPAAEEPMQSSDLDRELEREREPTGPRIRCPLCGWSPRKEDLWSCTCGHEWDTRSILGACAPPASTSGLRRSAFRVADGRRIPIGTRSDRAD